RLLDAADVAATFFPNAMYVRWAPDMWRDIAQRYPIGNHTAHHLALPGLTDRRIRSEIATDEQRVQATTGVPLIKVLRPPFGALSPRGERIAGALGYEHILLWDTSIGDSSPRSGDATMLRSATRGTAGSVILMHCGNRRTVALLPTVIAD